MKEDDILQIVVTGSIKSCVLFVKELELIDSMSIDNKIPDFEEVCKKLEETGLMLLG